MNSKGEFEIGLMGALAFVLIAGYFFAAFTAHDKNLLKLKALEKGCTAEQIQALTKDD